MQRFGASLNEIEPMKHVFLTNIDTDIRVISRMREITATFSSKQRGAQKEPRAKNKQRKLRLSTLGRDFCLLHNGTAKPGVYRLPAKYQPKTFSYREKVAACY